MQTSHSGKGAYSVNLYAMTPKAVSDVRMRKAIPTGHLPNAQWQHPGDTGPVRMGASCHAHSAGYTAVKLSQLIRSLRQLATNCLDEGATGSSTGYLAS